MSRRISVIFCLVLTLCIGTSVAASAATSTSPVAYVYVTSNYTGATTRIVAYTASPDGTLTQIPGSPFPDSVGSMAVNGKYLFATETKGSGVDRFLMESNGSLKMADTTDVQKFPDSTCATPGTLVFDHTGTTLYPFTYNADCSGDDDAYQSLDIVKSTGALTYMSETFAGQNIYYPLTFIGNNKYAYEASCVFEERSITGYKRESNGSLVNASTGAPYPTAADNEIYCPWYVTADPTNHLAIDMKMVVPPGETGPVPTNDQIASYTVDESNGNLTTTSTYDNMPHTAVFSVTAMNMAPSGKLLAVGGTKGLQIFHFNGADPLTVDTGLLTSDEINQVFWDNDNHLFAISNTSGKLFVFTVTATAHSEAPGSPYTITRPETLIVQPK